MRSKKLKTSPKKQVVRRGPHPSGDARKPSHIPLNTSEREKLQKGAARMGMPYATWARTTLLIVADWPLECQPIRLGREVAMDRRPVLVTERQQDGSVRTGDSQ